MKATPLQQVNDQFGSREKLVDTILPLLESKDDNTRSRLMGSSNSKLLRIHASVAEVKERFGSRKNLVEQILKLRCPNGKPDDGLVKSVEETTTKNLLDLYIQVGGN